jgi:hypothetical protein
MMMMNMELKMKNVVLNSFPFYFSPLKNIKKKHKKEKKRKKKAKNPHNMSYTWQLPG